MTSKKWAQKFYTDDGWCFWLVGNLLQPIRTTTQIWVVNKRHQFGISAFVSQTSFRGETSGGIAKCDCLLRLTMKLRGEVHLQQRPNVTLGKYFKTKNSLSIRRFWGKRGKMEANSPIPLGRPDTQARQRSNKVHSTTVILSPTLMYKVWFEFILKRCTPRWFPSWKHTRKH